MALNDEQGGEPYTLIPVMNNPSKVIALPNRYRDSILKEHRTCIGDLVGEDPFRAIFLHDGLAFLFFFQRPISELLEFVLHPLHFQDPNSADTLLAGAEVYGMWKSFPASMLISWDELQKNAKDLFHVFRTGVTSSC